MKLTGDAVVKIISVDDGSGDTVGHVVRKRIKGVEFFTVNTDTQVLRKTTVSQTIQISNGITRDLNADTNPEVGRGATDGDRETLHATLDGTDTIFIAVDMDGDTGTGTAPVVVEMAKDLGTLAVVAVMKPFNFEGKKRMAFAEQGITGLSKHIDSLITTPNDELLKVFDRSISLLDAFGMASDISKDATRDITELITRPGLVNADFANVRTMMSKTSYAVMGSGVASDEDRAEEAAEMTIFSPLLEDIDLSNARGVSVSVTTGFDPRLDKLETVDNVARALASDNAAVVIGTSLDPDMNDELHVTVVAAGTGIDKRPKVTPVTDKQIQQSVMDHYQ